MTTMSLDKKSSYEIGTYPEPIGPLRRKLYQHFNDFHEAVRLGDEAVIEELKRTIPIELDEFERTESQSSHNPRWRRRMTRAGWHCACREFELALEYERDGWEAANTSGLSIDNELINKQKSISASNIADELNRLGHFKESLQWARQSCQLWPGNPVNHLVFSISLFHAGLPDEAEKVLRSLIDFVQRSGPGSLQVAIYEDFLSEMTVPAAAELVQVVYAG